MTSDLQLPGYRIEWCLWRHAGRAAFRVCRETDGQVFSLETVEGEYPSRRQVAAVRHEAAITMQLQGIRGIRTLHQLLPHGSGNLALLTDLCGLSLAALLQRTNRQGLPVSQVLEIAQQLVATLHDVHAQEIVHKAINPHHVHYDSQKKQWVLAGFSQASELDQEQQTTQLASLPTEALPYISPEQTGRMNRSLDYRSDYYSLGVLLYELLTGKTPFNTDNPLEWVHSHISCLPRSPDEHVTTVPASLAAIVLKLLAKSPEERYQSSHGLLHDLSRCAGSLEQGNSAPTFPLGEKDHLQKFLISQTLYGREQELQQLLALFELAVAGDTRCCLVHGYSGVGKSALVNELDRHQIRERGFLVQSKFDQFQHREAYSAIAGAFRGLVQQILLAPDSELARWRQQLIEALAPNAALVVELVPELTLIIGEQPDVAQLPPAEARNRLHLTLTAFLRVFAGSGHPVVLFLDDLQWSDTPTLDLLRRIITSREQSHLLLIGAYRSNEITPGHPLKRLLDDLNNHQRMCQIALGPLDPMSVNQLVDDTLRCDTAMSKELSELLFHRSRGNPFFINELMRQLHHEGAISYNSQNGQWHWQREKADWSNASHDVVEFMLDSLRQLPPATQHLLQRAACLGNQFDLKTLALLNPAATGSNSMALTAQALQPALKHHTILPLHSDYRLVQQSDDELDLNPGYRFQHDRVQQAAYHLAKPEQLAQIHQSIGRWMLAQCGTPVPNEQLIDIVNHLNHGCERISDEAQRLQLAELNLRAGKRARHASAYTSALSYLHIAKTLLPEQPWDNVPELMNDLAAEMQQCLYLTGQIDAADHWFGILLSYADTPLDRASILSVRTRQCATLGRMDASIRAAIDGLALLGISFAEQPTQQDVENERQLTHHYLNGRAIADLAQAPHVDDLATLTAMRLLMEIFAAAFLSGSGNLFSYLVLKLVNLALSRGNCPEAAFAYAAYGMLLCGELDEPALGYQYAKVGLAINEQFDDLSLRARVIYVYAMFVHHWSNHWSTLTPWFQKGIEAGYQSGDLLYLAYSAQDCVIWDPTLDLETAERLHAENLEIVRECAYQDSLDSGTLFLQLQRNLLGLTYSADTLSSDSFSSEECLREMHARQFMTGIANHHIYHAEICLLYGDYERALTFIHQQDKLIKSAMSLPQLVRFYILANLTLTTHYPTMDADQQQITRERLDRDLARMTRWADNCEANFRHLQWLMTAELTRIDGLDDAALTYYERAIDTARANGFLHDEATALERAARHLLAQGKNRSAEGYLMGALRVYDRWGAVRKVDQLKAEFPVLRALQPTLSEASPLGLANLDLAAIMKASREISGEMVLEQLLKKTMSVLLESAGGQWGCLIVRNQQGLLRIEASLRSPAPDSTAIPERSGLQDLAGNSVALPMTIISHVLQRDEAIVLENAAAEGGFAHDPYCLKQQPRSVLCVPIIRERFEAAVYMENNLASGVFDEARVEMVRLLAAQAAVATENARLYAQVQEYSNALEQKVTERTHELEQLNQELQRLADKDGLTGVANRRSGDVYLKNSWLRLRRENQPLSIIMLDVDHFKLFNDNYGHQMGDECLKSVAAALQAQLRRTTDVVTRYGGEEFMLILPNTDRNGAYRVAENVRRAIEGLEMEHAWSTTGNKVTISVGVATTIPTDQNSSEQLVNVADQALYQAKRLGRNRIQESVDLAPTARSG